MTDISTDKKLHDRHMMIDDIEIAMFTTRRADDQFRTDAAEEAR